jgi:S-adenosylmethionine hydrolase
MILTLLTDFGDADGFTGAMKGVILARNPQVTVVDVAHHIPPQDVAHAAFVLLATYACFPPGTIHVVVVDPGVGGARRAVAARLGEWTFVAPDNGCLTHVLAEEPCSVAVELTEARFFRQPVSATFHGRDVFAPVAAHLSLGVPLSAFGPAVDTATLVRLPAAEVQEAEETLIGHVIHIDRFGNLLTNFTARRLADLRQRRPGTDWQVWLGEVPVGPVRIVYSAVPVGAPVALVSSAGTLEIAVNQGHAAQHFAAGRGTVVRVSAA